MTTCSAPNWRNRAKAQAQVLRSVVRAYPSTLLWPLLLFALLCGVGVWAVTRGAQSSAESAQVHALSLAKDAALEYRQLLSIAFSLTRVLASLVHHNPQYDSVSHLFNATADALASAAPLTSVRSLELIPSGVVRLMHPRGGNTDYEGVDLFNVTEPAIVDSVRRAIQNPMMSLEGPFLSNNGTETVLVVRKAIFVPVDDPHDTFGRPDKPNPKCGEACDYNAATGHKFWGLAAVIVRLDSLRTPLGDLSVSLPLRSLALGGYRYALVAPAPGGPPVGLGAEVLVEGSPEPPPGGRHCVEAVVDLGSDVEWVLRVGPSGSSWMPSWYGGVIAAVVILSLAASLLLFGLLVSRWRHKMLLQSLLPNELIKDLQAEHAESVLGPRLFMSESPADLLLGLLGALLSGQAPDLRDVVLLRTVLQRHLDVYRPLNLGGRIRDANLDTEVANALMRQLGDSPDLLAGSGWCDTPGTPTWGLGKGGGSRPRTAAQLQAHVPAAAAAATTGSLPDLMLSTLQQREQQLMVECHTVAGALAFLLSDYDAADCPSTSTPPSMRRQDLPSSAQDLILDEAAFGGPTAAAAAMVVGGAAAAASDGAFSIIPSPTGLAASACLLVGPGPQQPPIPNQPPSQPSSPVQSQPPASRSRLGSGSGLFLRIGPAWLGAQESSRKGSPLSLARCVMVVPDNNNTAAEGSGGSFHCVEPQGLASITGAAGAAAAAAAAAAAGASVTSVDEQQQGSQGAGGQQQGAHGLERLGSGLATLRAFASRRRSVGPIRSDTDSPRNLLQGSLTASAAAACAAARGSTGDTGCTNGNGNGNGDDTDAGDDELTAGNALAVVAAEAPPLTSRITPPPRPLVEEVERLLAQSERWQFDTWGLQDASGGRALSLLGFYLIQRGGFLERFRMEPLKLARLLRTLEAGYHATNPYHNSAHAADVLRTLHVLLHGSRMTPHYVDPLGLLACYFAAIVHDYGHPGLTNDFLIATSHPLALRYNDRSPLESHHSSAAFTLLAERPDLDALAGLTRAERAAFRKQVIEMVLATDMKQHFAILKHFTTVHRLASTSTGPQQHGARAPSGGGGAAGGPSGSPAGTQGGALERQSKTPTPTHRDASCSRGVHGGGASGCPSTDEHSGSGDSSALVPAPVPVDEAERMLSLQVLLKVADIGHLGADLERHKRWLGVLEEEFFRQGDREQQLGLTVSPLFDRAKQGVSKSQVGFFDFVALPLVHAVVGAFPGAGPLLRCFQANYHYWREVEGTPPPPPAPAAAAPTLTPAPTGRLQQDAASTGPAAGGDA